jgi:hypothetical protein
MSLDEENYGISSSAAETAESIQESTSFLPDYAFAEDAENPAGTTVSGLVGVAMVAVAALVIGLIGGHFLGQTVLPVTEGAYMHFVHDPDVRTYLYSALITAGFSALISSAALRRVKDLRLTDIN